MLDEALSAQYRNETAPEVANNPAEKQLSYYDQNPDLKPFDNGDGAFTWGLNSDVEKRELTAYGRKALQASDSDKEVTDAEALARASQDLALVLQTKPKSVATDYVTRILDKDAATVFKANGGAAFFPAEEAADEPSHSGTELFAPQNSRKW